MAPCTHLELVALASGHDAGVDRVKQAHLVKRLDVVRQLSACAGEACAKRAPKWARRSA